MMDQKRNPRRALGRMEFFRENRRLLLGSLAFAIAAIVVAVVVRALHIQL